MNYCVRGQWVVIMTTGQIGTVHKIVKRRMPPNEEGVVDVQCGAGGPFVMASMSVLREATGKERQEAEGVILPGEPFKEFGRRNRRA